MRQIYKRTVALKARFVFQRIVGHRGGGNGSEPRTSPISEQFAVGLHNAVARGVPLLFLYGREDSFYEEFSRARLTSLQSVFARPRAALDVRIVDGVIHGFSTLAVQDDMLQEIVAWVDRITPASTAPETPDVRERG